METFNLAQLTKEMVVGQLRSIEDPTRLAAEAAAREARVDQELVATAAIKGISDARRFVGPEILAEMRRHVEGIRHGGGQVLEQFCADLCSHQSHPGYIPAGT
jgi:hypothetical protein